MLLVQMVQKLEDLEKTGQVETIQTTLSARILRRVQETWGDLMSLKSRGKPSANSDGENSQGIKYN